MHIDTSDKQENLKISEKICTKEKDTEKLNNNSSQILITVENTPIELSYILNSLQHLKNIIQTQEFFEKSFPIKLSYSWHTQWKNLHQHYNINKIEEIFQEVLLINRLLINNLYIKSTHNNLKIIINSFGLFNEHQARKIYKIYIKFFAQELIKRKIIKYSALYLHIYNVKKVQIHFYITYLPKNKFFNDVVQVFKKNRNDRYFKITLQLIHIVYRAEISPYALSQHIFYCIRKNPSRIRFLSFLKRVIDWYFETITIEALRISGVRVEIKGRFNAKSRARKQILSVGRVRLKEQESPVSYKKVVAITKFGSLSIKVWICPK
jgi:hypothetical protein